MNATIVKNDNFETIGFEVRAENESKDVIFAWGISPSSMYYVKSVINKELEFIVSELIRTSIKALHPSELQIAFLRCNR